MWIRNAKDPQKLKWVGNSNNGYEISISEAMREIRKARYRADIQDAADRAGITFKVSKELRELEHELKAGEKVLVLTPATYNDERGLLVATTDRVVFLFHGWVNRTFISFDYRIVSNARWLGGFVMGRLRLYTYGSETGTKFTSVWNPVGKKFIEAVSDRSAHSNQISREQYEMSLIVSSLPKHEYQIRENDVIADKIVALDASFHIGEIDEKSYVEQKRDLLYSMN